MEFQFVYLSKFQVIKFNNVFILIDDADDSNKLCICDFMHFQRCKIFDNLRFSIDAYLH